MSNSSPDRDSQKDSAELKKKNEEAEILNIYNELKNSKFKQQEMPSWRPKATEKGLTITFTIFGITFVTLGIWLYVLSDNIQDVKVRYDTPDMCGQAAYSAEENADQANTTY